ncbi:MAG: ATP-binding protein [Oscillospiraceae bacterium]|nr:ATP-binding protein [Oscillospiraceae bacterium]
MSKNVTKIVLTGGPAAGKTTLISRILKEFKQENGWRVITIPESATDLISGFGIKPFGNCMSMLAFQDFVIADQLHKEKLALQAAETVPEDNIIIIYDRALMDDKAYISDEEFAEVISRFDGRTEQSVLANYDAVLHLVTCAKGAEFAYNLGNAARTESIEYAREMDDRTLRAWQGHPNLKIIDNSENFEVKMRRAIQEVYRIVGEPAPQVKKSKFLISMPLLSDITEKYGAVAIDMMQTYLRDTTKDKERRVRQQRNGDDYLYFYNEKHFSPDGSRWDTEKPISEKKYVRYLMECDESFHAVRKTKYRFVYNSCRYEIDVYPFCSDKAVLFCYTGSDEPEIPDGIRVIKNVTDDPMYKNKQFAKTLTL